jgi:C-methyltransferase
LPTKVKVPPAKLARAVERFRYHLNRLNQRLVPPFGAIMELTLEAWVSQAVMPPPNSVSLTPSREGLYP